MPTLVTDFDGTISRRDFFDLILERHPTAEGHDAWRRYLEGEITHAEGIGGVFASLRTDEAGADALVEALDPAPGTAAAILALQEAGWRVVIASAGCAWYIERLLAKLKVTVTVHACPGAFTPEAGLVLQPDPSAPWFEPRTLVDKTAIVRHVLTEDPVAAYAGDSLTDREGALLVPAERRFARGWLARRFERDGVPCTPFAAWPEIADRLLAGS
jgi:2-hydroxy-3-keto-5-methylthiopentenyl-1-phosphate phosphatase